jgi:hypothetical protein
VHGGHSLVVLEACDKRKFLLCRARRCHFSVLKGEVSLEFLFLSRNLYYLLKKNCGLIKEEEEEEMSIN